VDILEHLEQEHRKVESLMDQLSESDPGEERDRMVQELTEALHIHMEVEERFLYPIVAQVAGQETEQEADIEHSLAREGLATINDLSKKPGFGAAVDMLKGGVGHHVEEEEKEIFPKLRADAHEQIKALDPEALETEVKRDGATKDELYRQARAADVPGRSNMTKDELARAVGDASAG